MFYEFRQNNSGGSFVHDPDAGISKHVIVEAPSLKRATAIAQSIGLYFNGVDDGYDCECCGDRWYEPWNDEGTEEPSIYDKVVTEEYEDTTGFGMKWIDGPEAYVHYADGAVQGFLR